MLISLRRLMSVVFLAGLAPATIISAQSPLPPEKPKLAVLLIVDQMRPDYLTRFDKLYTAGFRRLLDSGAVFLNGFHDHAATETAVGHTTVSTGRFPSHHGIIGNEYWDRSIDTLVYCVGDTAVRILGDSTSERVSPKNIDGPTIGDLLKIASPTSKVISIALKDRAAICLAGHKADGVYWYSRRNGNYITSSYYQQVEPKWVDSFNTAKQVNSYFVAGWQKAMPEKDYALSDPDSTSWEYDGKDIVFPHVFTKRSAEPDEKYYSALYRSPFSDMVSLSLAQAAVHYEQLGADSATDVLCVSLSAADAIGHAFGPMSEEAEDYYLRLDQGLGDFFTYLDTTIGRDSYVVCVSTDHATMLAPEDLQRQGIDAGRLNYDTVGAQMLAVGKHMSDEGFERNPIVRVSGGEIFVDTTLIGETSLSISELENRVGDALKKLPYIADYYTRQELSKDTPKPRPYWEQYLHCYRTDRGPDLFIRFKENYILASHPTATTHGSPYWYDANVPIIFMGAGVIHGSFSDTVKTVDIAPTLAALLRIPTDGKFDGKVLTQALDR